MKSFSYNRIFVIGLGFFVISVVWQVYNAFMPLMLADFIESKSLIGMIMGIDNFANLILIPIIGAWSDRISTQYGKRLPFLMIGMPLAALFLLLMPNYNSLWFLILVDIGFLLSMTIFRAPTVSLMPDVTPSEKRSPANGVINFMGGLGALVAFFVLAPLYDHNHLLPFYLTAGVMLLVLVTLFFVLINIVPKEDEGYNEETQESQVGIVKGIIEIFRRKDRAMINLLFAIFFWFIAYSGVDTLFTIYGTETLELSKGSAALLLGFMSVSFIIFAIPSGFLAKYLGRTRVIQIGLLCMAVALIGLFFVENLLLIRVFLLFGGISWALINIHSYPMVVDMTTQSKIGLYTGIYYLFSSLSQMVGPTIVGFFMDMFGNRYLFLSSTIFALIAFYFITRVHSLHKNGGSKQNNGEAPKTA